MPMTLEAVQSRVTLFLEEIQSAITEDLLDVEFVVCESREAAVVRLNSVLDKDDEPVTLAEIPAEAKGLFFGDPATRVDEQDNDGETTETIECAAGIIILLAPNLVDDDEVDIILLHEIGHALGLDEDEVDALGLGLDDEETPENPAPESSESKPADDTQKPTTTEPQPTA